MAILRFGRRARTRHEPEANASLTDDELLALFGRRPERAWDLFLDRYADFVLGLLHHLGFDHDQAMDRFVYICERLVEDDFRRLRGVRFAGQHGELVPWLRTVVKNLSINWAWSVDGRRRLFRSIAKLPRREQRVFELYFWHGLSPSEVDQRLRAETQEALGQGEVFEALDVVFAHLSENQTWRLMSQLQRHRPKIPIAAPEPGGELGFEPAHPGDDPEAEALGRERRRVADEALAELPARDRLILQLRYEEALALAEVAKLLDLGLSTVKGSIRRSLEQLRRTVEERTTPRPAGEAEADPCPA